MGHSGKFEELQGGSENFGEVGEVSDYFEKVQEVHGRCKKKYEEFRTSLQSFGEVGGTSWK